MNVDLPAEAAEFIKGLVESGEYQPADEAVADGVRLLMGRQTVDRRMLYLWLTAKRERRIQSLPTPLHEQFLARLTKYARANRKLFCHRSSRLLR